MSEKEKPLTVDEAECVVMNMADLADRVPTAGMEFAESVMEKAQDILTAVRAEDVVSPARSKALMNMCAGLEKWVR